MELEMINCTKAKENQFKTKNIESVEDLVEYLPRKYYDFMKRLTGKRSIKTYEVTPQNSQKPQEQKTMQEVNFTNSSVFNKMIKG